MAIAVKPRLCYQSFLWISVFWILGIFSIDLCHTANKTGACIHAVEHKNNEFQHGRLTAKLSKAQLRKLFLGKSAAEVQKEVGIPIVVSGPGKPTVVKINEKGELQEFLLTQKELEALGYEMDWLQSEFFWNYHTGYNSGVSMGFKAGKIIYIDKVIVMH